MLTIHANKFDLACVLDPSSHMVQVLLTSEALEITARRCLSSPYPSKADLAVFTQLLSAVLPPTIQKPVIQACVSALHDLTSLLPGNSNEVTAQAQKAVGAVIACFKDSQPAAENASSAQSVNSDIPERAAALSDEIYALQSSLPEDATARWAPSCTFL